VSGYERSSSGSFPYDESLFIKLDGEGNVIWEKTFDTKSNDWPINIKTTADGGYISAVNYYGNAEPYWSSNDVRLIKLDDDGNLIWSFDYIGQYGTDIRAQSIMQSADLNYVIVGKQETAENSNIFEGWSVKIGTDDIVIQNPDDPDDPILDDFSLSFDGVNDYVGTIKHKEKSSNIGSSGSSGF
jgi:hypothetical protein